VDGALAPVSFAAHDIKNGGNIVANTKRMLFLRYLSLGALMLTLFGFGSGALAAPASQTGADLFSDATAAGDDETVQDLAVVRSRFVEVNLDLLGGADALPDAQSGVADTLALNLFEDVTLTAVLDELMVNPSGSRAWTGHLEDVPYSQVNLVVKEGVMVGTIASPEGLYQVGYVGGSIHAVTEIDQAEFPPEMEPIPADVPLEPLVGVPLAPMADDGSIIDVLVVYTDDARAGQGGTTAIQNLIDQAVLETNQSYANSGVDQRVRLVHTEEVTYDEADFDWGTTLGRLTGKTDGYIDHVHTLRDTYCADEVVLIVNATAGSCGIGWVMQSVSTSFEGHAFTVVSRHCATGNYSFAHEMGHNMGCAHDRANASVLGAYDYSFGYQAPDEAFRTIMAYNCPGGCPRIDHWSNPDVSYGGQPTGVVYTAPDSADNRRTLNNTALTVANFRDSGVCGPPPTYAISGYVRTSGGSGISGVVMNGLPGNPPTDGNGYYSAEVNHSWSGNVTPQLSGYTFSPPDRSYANVTSDQTDQNYTGTIDTYTISGYVRDSSGSGISGVTVDFGGAQPAVTTDGSGFYTQSDFDNGTYTVTVSHSGVVFSPKQDQVTISGADATHDVTGYTFNPASLPFIDGFEGGTLGSAWAVETDFEGRVQVGSADSHAGTYSLLLDDDTDGALYSHAAAILALDLSGHPQADLSFWWRDFVDEDHADDGVFISDDYGQTWYQVVSFNGGPITFTQAAVDLDAQAGLAGMSLNDHFLVKFQFYDNWPIDPGESLSDGYGIDDVEVTGQGLFYHSQTIDDDTSGQSNGNGDSRVDCGEQIELTVGLSNVGSATATDIVASISESDPYITFTHNLTSAFSDIAGLGTGAGLDDFEIDVDPNTPHVYRADLHLSVEANGSGPWISDFEVVVYCATDWVYLPVIVRGN
jgi:hypothetical protein